jgi:Yip1-like protein
MNPSSNSPMMADPDFPPSQGAFPVWSKVYAKPRERTFVEITEHREATARSAYIWVFMAGTLAGVINSLLQFIIALMGVKAAVPQFGQITGLGVFLGTAGLLGAICSAPLIGIISVIGFAISVAIIHVTARFFGGQGSFNKLAYAFGAIAVPFSLISGLIAPLNAIRYAGFCALPLLVLLLLYVIFLEVTAIKAVHCLGWGEAVGALFLPTILLVLLCGVAFFGLMRFAGPAFNEFYRQLQQIQPGLQ